MSEELDLIREAKAKLDRAIQIMDGGGGPPPPVPNTVFNTTRHGNDVNGKTIFKIECKSGFSVVTDQRSGGHRAWSHSGDWLLLKHMNLATAEADLYTYNTRTHEHHKIAVLGVSGGEPCWAYNTDHVWLVDSTNQKLNKVDTVGNIVSSTQLPTSINGPAVNPAPVRAAWTTGFFGAQKHQFVYTTADILNDGKWDQCYQFFDGDTGALSHQWWHLDKTNFPAIKDPFPLNSTRMLFTFHHHPDSDVYHRMDIDGRHLKVLRRAGDEHWSHAMGEPEGDKVIATAQGDIVVTDSDNGRELNRLPSASIKAALGTPHWVAPVYYAPQGDTVHILYKILADVSAPAQDPVPTGIMEYRFTTNSVRDLVGQFTTALDFRIFHTTPSSSLHKSQQFYSWKYREAADRQICTYYVR